MDSEVYYLFLTVTINVINDIIFPVRHTMILHLKVMQNEAMNMIMNSLLAVFCAKKILFFDVPGSPDTWPMFLV